MLSQLEVIVTGNCFFVSISNHDGCLYSAVKVCSFGSGTVRLQKKREKPFWECTFALLNLKRKFNIEGQHVYCFSHVGDSITNRRLNWFPLAPFLVYIHGTCLTFGKPFVRKQLTSQYYSIVSAKSVELPIKLSEDCYCNLSVPIPNGQTLGMAISI